MGLKSQRFRTNQMETKVLIFYKSMKSNILEICKTDIKELIEKQAAIKIVKIMNIPLS